MGPVIVTIHMYIAYHFPAILPISCNSSTWVFDQINSEHVSRVQKIFQILVKLE